MARQSREGANPAFLVTRPAEQGRALADTLHARFGPDIRVVQSPLLAPSYLSPRIDARAWTGILFTSATGVEAARRLGLGTGLPAYCVGEATARVARAAGYDARSAEGDARDLERLVKDQHLTGPLLHARGEDVTGNLAQAFNSAGIETIEAVVYRQLPQALTAEAQTLLAAGDLVIAPLYSPRTARLLSEALSVHPAETPIAAAALSSAVARAIAFPTQDVVIADRPDASAMLTALAGLLATARQP